MHASLPDSSNILENIGVSGNSAICNPRGDVKLQSSSIAEIKNSMLLLLITVGL